MTALVCVGLLGHDWTVCGGQNALMVFGGSRVEGNFHHHGERAVVDVGRAVVVGGGGDDGVAAVAHGVIMAVN